MDQSVELRDHSFDSGSILVFITGVIAGTEIATLEDAPVGNQVSKEEGVNPDGTLSVKKGQIRSVQGIRRGGWLAGVRKKKNQKDTTKGGIKAPLGKGFLESHHKGEPGGLTIFVWTSQKVVPILTDAATK